MSKVKIIDENNFNQAVIQSEQPVMVDFWAPWCGPCRMLGPVVETLAEENIGRIEVGKINVDENQNLAMEYGIRGVPTLAFFKGGQEVKRVVGAQGKAQLQKVIDEIVK